MLKLLVLLIGFVSGMQWTPSESKLIQAASNRSVTGLRKLISKLSVDIDSQSLMNQIFLSAAIGGNLPVVKMMLNIYDADCKVNQGEALANAAISGSVKLVEYMLNECDINPSANRDAAIRMAAAHGKINIVDLLLEFSGTKLRRERAFIAACRHSQLEVMEHLIQKRVNVNANGGQAAREAVLMNNLPVFTYLLHSDAFKDSAFVREIAVLAMNPMRQQIVKLMHDEELLDFGTKLAFQIYSYDISKAYDMVMYAQKNEDMMIKSSDFNAGLLATMQTGQVKHHDLLRIAGASLETLDRVPLIKAAFFGHVANLTRELDNLHSSISASLWKLYLDSALSFAAYQGHVQCARLLIETGADIHTQLDQPMMIAIQFNRQSMVELLVKEGADISANNQEALMTASHYGNEWAAKYLVQLGVDLQKWRQEAINLAQAEGHTKLARQLSIMKSQHRKV